MLDIEILKKILNVAICIDNKFETLNIPWPPVLPFGPGYPGGPSKPSKPFGPTIKIM